MKLRLLCALVALAFGCKRTSPPPPPEIGDVRIVYKSADAPGSPTLDLPALGRAARAAIVSASGLALREDGGVDAVHDARQRRYRLRVELEIGAAEDLQAKKGNLRALVDARLVPLGGEPGSLTFEQSALAERAYDVGKPGEPAWQAHAERAVRDCVAGVGARVKLADGDAKAIVVAIDGPDDDLREEAIRLAAERKEVAAVPPLVKRLKGEDRAVRDRAIGALAAIGDARAVRPLTEVAKFNELSDLPKVLDALATIGGVEARSYLEFVASGHDSPDIRDLAKEALVHLDRREADRRRDLSVR